MKQRPWPLHPRPFEAEALSSWLDRVAAVYDFSLEDLLIYDLGYELSTYDLDYNPSNKLLEIISHRSHLSFDRLYRMTFRSWMPFILDPHELAPHRFETYVFQYLFLLSSYASSYSVAANWRPWFGHCETVRACQLCLESNLKGVIHLSWKLPFMMTCPLHKCRLQACINYSRGYVYWKKEEVMDHPVTKDILTMDRRTQQALMTGKVDLARGSIHAGVWFRFLRSLLNELSLPLSCHRARRTDIEKIWHQCGYPLRAGLHIWKPYEYLSLPLQMMLLEASATAMGMFEAGKLQVSGKFFRLFLPDPMSEDDWPPGHLEFVPMISQSRSFEDLFDQAVAKAKTDREAAQELRALYLWGRKDPDVIKQIDAIFLKLGIPFDFL